MSGVLDGDIAQYEGNYSGTLVVTDKRSVYYFGRVYYSQNNQGSYFNPPKKFAFPEGIIVKRVFGSRSISGGDLFYYTDDDNNLYEEVLKMVVVLKKLIPMLFMFLLLEINYKDT